MIPDTIADDDDPLHHQAHVLQAILKHLPQGVSVFDDQLRLQHWNDKLLEVLELPEAVAWQGAPFDDLIRVPAQRGEYGPGDIEEMIRQRRELALRFVEHRFERTRHNGKTMLVQGVPLHVDGRVVGFVTTYTDITDRKEHEGKIERLNEELEERVVERTESLTQSNLQLESAKVSLQGALGELEAIFESALHGIILLRDRKLTRCNRRFQQMMGYGALDLQQMPVRDWYVDQLAYEVAASAYDSLKITNRYSHEQLFRRKNGSEFWVSITGRALDPKDPIDGTVWLIEDISERKETEGNLRHANEMLSQTVHALERRDGQIKLLNRAHDLLLSCHTRDEAFKVVTSLVQQLFPGMSGALATRGAEGSGLETRVRWGAHGPYMSDDFDVDECWAFRQGRPHEVVNPGLDPVCQHFHPAFEGASICLPLVVQGRIFGSLWVGLDAGEQFDDGQRQLLTTVADAIKLSLSNLELREALREQASRDPLTNLFNRRYLMETMKREIARAQRSERSFCVALIDIDHFKRLNDNFGHDAGDAALKSMAQMLLEQTRQSDTVCRYGGEEFVVLLPETSPDDALGCIEKIRKTMERTTFMHGNSSIGPLTFSAGLACATNHGFDPAKLISVADSALYSAKENGRNQVVRAE